MSSLQALIEQKAALERQIAATRNVARAEAIAEIRTLIATNGLTAADLSTAGAKGRTTDRRAPLGTGAKVAAKYRDPDSGATWTGRGLKPRWLTQQLAHGKQVSDFAL